MTAEPATKDPATEPSTEQAAPEPAAEPAAAEPAAVGPDAVEPAVAEPEAAPALPSIIVDPSLSSPDLEPVPAPAEPAPSDAAFDSASADRFAAAYRPSWEAGSLAAVSAPISAHPSLPPEIAVAVGGDEPFTPLQTRAARRRAMLWVAAAVTGFVLLAYLGISSSTKTEKPESWDTTTTKLPGPAARADTASADQAPQEGSGAADAPAESPQPTAASPARRVQVRTEPVDAQLILDGAGVDNPLDVQLASGPHTLEARAQGFMSSALPVPPEGDVELVIKLTATAPAPAPTPVPTPIAPTPEPAHGAAAPEPKPARTPAAPPAVSAPTKRKAPTTATRSTSKTAPKPAAKPKKGAGFVADSPY